MQRFRAALFVVVTATLHPVAAFQADDTFTISKSTLADVHQETLQVFNSASKQTVEVFPGTYQSPLGTAVMTRIETMKGRLSEADRTALMKSKAEAGFDRLILNWRADAAGRRVVLAVRYYREPLFHLQLEQTDDYGRGDPVIPGRFEFFAIATCSRQADAWTCTEEQFAEAAKRLNFNLPQDRIDRIAVAAQLVKLVFSEK